MKSVSLYDVGQVIGKEATQALVDAFPGCRIYLGTDPSAVDFPDKIERNVYIANLYYSSSLNAKQIAERTGLEERTIHRILAEQCKKK